MAEPRKCDVCGRPYTPKRSDSRYCSRACNQKAKRIRRKPELVPQWSAPSDPEPSVPADVMAAVLAAHRVANDFGRLADRAPFQLRAACGRISAAVQAALDAEGF